MQKGCSDGCHTLIMHLADKMTKAIQRIMLANSGRHGYDVVGRPSGCAAVRPLAAAGAVSS